MNSLPGGCTNSSVGEQAIVNMEEFGGHYAGVCWLLCGIAILLFALLLPDYYSSNDSDVKSTHEVCELESLTTRRQFSNKVFLCDNTSTL